MFTEYDDLTLVNFKQDPNTFYRRRIAHARLDEIIVETAPLEAEQHDVSGVIDNIVRMPNASRATNQEQEDVSVSKRRGFR